MLTDALDEQGFVVLEPVFDRLEIDRTSAALSDLTMARSRAGARHVLRHPPVAALAGDSRLLRIAQDVLGTAALPFRATLFDKSPLSNWLVAWHQDTALPVRARRDLAGWGPWSVKGGVVHAHAPATALAQVLALRLHLDDSSQESGPLRVLPGTHRLGVLKEEELQALGRTRRSVDCLVARGGVLAMRPLLVHASSKSKSRTPRRVLHIEYAGSVMIEERLELAVT